MRVAAYALRSIREPYTSVQYDQLTSFRHTSNVRNAGTPSYRLGNQPIKRFRLVVAQVSRSTTRMFIDATAATFDRAVSADRFGQHKRV
jgi:hypothetical protein